jgi:hypothetical protein
VCEREREREREGGRERESCVCVEVLLGDAQGRQNFSKNKNPALVGYFPYKVTFY